MGKSKDLATLKDSDLTLDTDTFHVDLADNRVGIGTTTPVHDLQIHKATASSQARIQMTTNESGATNGDGYAVAMEAGNRVYHWLYENAPMQFATNNTLNMVINANGSVTMPNQPSFAAGVSANNWTTSSAADAPFDSEIFDIGNNYNTSNYTFTAPVAGRYFTSLFLNRYTDSRFDVGFMVNGSARHVAEVRDEGATSGGAWHVESFQMILNLAANDTVKLRITSVTSTGTAIFDGNGTYYDVFSMHLLG